MSKKLTVVRGEDDIQEAEVDLLSSALAVANKGQKLIFERMDEMGDQQLVAATQMATRTVSTKRRWQHAPTSGEGTGVALLAERLKSMPPGVMVMVTCHARPPWQLLAAGRVREVADHNVKLRSRRAPSFGHLDCATTSTPEAGTPARSRDRNPSAPS